MNVNPELDDAGLDRVLAMAAPLPAMPPALARRILAQFDRVQARGRWLRRLVDAVWPDGPVWQPVGAFAVALLIGLGVAAFAPFDLPQQDDGTAAVFALDGAPDIDAGHGI